MLIEAMTPRERFAIIIRCIDRKQGTDGDECDYEFQSQGACPN